MALWQVLLGVGLGVIVSFITLIQIAERDRAIQHNPRPKHGPHITSPDDNCPICLELMENDTMSYLCCGHAIHEVCFRALLRHGAESRRCPTCRSNISI